MPPAEELVVPHLMPRDRVPMATRVRGTVMLASIRGLRKRGYDDIYMKLLPREHQQVVESLTVASWLPVDFAMAHYEACNKLGLDRQTAEQIGVESGQFVNEMVLATVSKLTKEAGVSPWLALGYSNKLMARTWLGSSVSVTKVGPKEARLEWIQQPVSRFAYFRAAFGGFTEGILGMFARTIYVREIPAATRDTEVSYRVSWV